MHKWKEEENSDININYIQYVQTLKQQKLTTGRKIKDNKQKEIFKKAESARNISRYNFLNSEQLCTIIQIN
jgi:hypothetical protein